jgi:hypothetical protein
MREECRDFVLALHGFSSLQVEGVGDGLTRPLVSHVEYVHLLYEHDLGHRDVSMTMIYTLVLNRGGKGSYSPLDRF